MSKARQLTDSEKKSILKLRKKNLSQQQIALKIGRSQKVVFNFLKDPINYGNRQPKTHKKKVTERVKRIILNAASNGTISAGQIVVQNQLNLHRSTVCRVINACPHLKRQKKMPHHV